MKHTRIGIKIALFVSILVVLFQFAASAAPIYETPYTTFVYNKNKQTVASKPGYLPEKVLTGAEMGTSDLNGATDMYTSPDKKLYILDNGNSRVVVLDSDFKFEREITFKHNGQSMAIGIPEKSAGFSSSIFVDDEEMLIADPVQRVVHIFDLDGNLKGQLTDPSPTSTVIAEGFNFTPCKVVKDNDGVFYVLSYGCYQGIMRFEKNYEFIDFYGADDVTLTADVVWDYFWKQILPSGEKLSRYVPTNYLSIDIDDNNFVYAVKYESDNIGAKGQLKKLNPNGDDIIVPSGEESKGSFGIIDTRWDEVRKYILSRLSDVVYDDSGFITVLDTYQNRIFQYDDKANLLFVYGGESNDQQGNFENPVAIESVNDKIVVLDYDRNNITVFQRTEYGALFHEGMHLVNEGQYAESKQIWEEVLKNDSMNSLANSGYGKALLDEGKYNDAMYYLKLGSNKKDYSTALGNVRDDIMSSLFPVLMVVIVLALLAYFIVPKILRKYKKSEYDVSVSRWKYPFHVMMHPINGYTNLKFEKKGSMLVANIILLGFFIISIIVRQATGYIFNNNDLDTFNIFFTLLSSIGMFIFFVIAQWAVSMLMSGEGKLSEIWIFSAYALLPYVILMIPVTLLSMVFTLDEQAFLTIANIIVLAWTGMGILLGTREAHQFSMIKTLALLLLTVLGMFFVILIVGLVYSMLARLISFIAQILTELSLR